MEKLSCFGVSRNCFYYLRGCRVENVMKSIIAWVSLLYFCFKGDGLAWKPLSFLLQSLKEYFCLKPKKGRGTVNFGHGGFHPPVSPCWGGRAGAALQSHNTGVARLQNRTPTFWFYMLHVTFQALAPKRGETTPTPYLCAWSQPVP